MLNDSPEIYQLRADIEAHLHHSMHTPLDFEYLSVSIREALNENISVSTIKRLWGYVQGTEGTRVSTLTVFARFLGYADWADYVSQLAQATDSESEMFIASGFRAVDLQPGDRIEVTWRPDRHCIFRALGDLRFEVEQAENAKIHEGDTFLCGFFIPARPMYLDQLVQGTNPPSYYVAGKRHGLSSVCKLK